MTLTSKIIFSVAVTVSVCLLLNVFLVHQHLDETFESYEDKDVARNTARLSIAYDVVVNKHNGTIVVDSEPGEGTCFIIRLPICEQDDHANEVLSAVI